MKTKCYISLILFLFLVSCSGIGKSLIKSPDLTVTNITISKLSKTQQVINLKIRIDNPNPFTLPVRGFSYNFSVNENEFIKGFYDNSFDVRSNGNSEIDLELSGNLLDVINKFDISALKKVEYKLAGDISLLSKDLTFPYQYRGEMSVINLF